MASMADTMPELVLVTETDAATARRARRLAAQGTLKRLYPRIYTSNVDSPPGIDRSAALADDHRASATGRRDFASFGIDSRPYEGNLSITRGKTRRDLRLPGLTVHIVPGPGPPT